MEQNTPLRSYHLDTIALHGGTAPDPATGARMVPIYQTTSFVFRNAQHAADLFNLDEAGNIYTRIGNPTTDALEKRVALMEEGVAAVAFASGQAAITATVTNLCRAGDELVASSALYGGTVTLLSSTLADMGIVVRFAETLEDAGRLINDRTRAVLVETIGNPKLDVADIAAWARLAHAGGVPLIVDNTFATPYLCRPLSMGADIVIHSLTKWMGGHGAAMGGVVVDGGHFNYHRPQYPQFSEPDSSYHGMVYAKEFGGLAFSTRLRVKLLRDTGAALSPFNAFLILLGIETLGIRMERMGASAQLLAEKLAAHPDVVWVNYPGLRTHPTHELATRVLSGQNFGAMLSFGIRGGKAAGIRLINALGLWSHVANVGDARSLVIHPASTTHQQLNEGQLQAAGVSADLIRLSVGLEHPQDLWDDLAQAIDRSQRRVPGRRVLNDESVIQDICVTSQKADGRPLVLAVVGLSPHASRPSYRTARKLQRMGYRIVPVNPAYQGDILGEKAYASLSEIPFPVDVVQIFRASDAALAAVQEALPLDVPVVWLQEGVINPEAAELAHAHGKAVVMNRCLFKEVQRLRGSIVTYPVSVAEQ